MTERFQKAVRDQDRLHCCINDDDDDNKCGDSWRHACNYPGKRVIPATCLAGQNDVTSARQNTPSSLKPHGDCLWNAARAFQVQTSHTLCRLSGRHLR